MGLRHCLVMVGAAATLGCANAPEPAPPASLEETGRTLFTQETFGGNGRVCSTCHEPDQFGTITPAFVQELFASDPGGPLFRPIDSDDGLGASYDRLKTYATVRIPIELPVRTVTGFGIRQCEDPAATEVNLHRGNPSIFNVALEAHLMHDGRDGDDLAIQALNAVHTHAEPTREPAPGELAAIAAFQASQFSHDALAQYLRTTPDLELPDGVTASEKRGRAFFEPDRQCGQCHSGPLLNRTSRFHPNAVGFAFESAFVGREPDNPNEKFMWCYVDLATNQVAPGPFGARHVFSYPVSDPGLALMAGVQDYQRPDGEHEFIPNEVLAALAGPLFKIPTLWGTPDTAPYFHDNSALTLRDVLDQYNFVFGLFPDGEFGLGCDRSRPECLNEADKTDIVNFMQLLSFERRPTPGRQH
jgi:cytochrome c peroxidase